MKTRSTFLTSLCAAATTASLVAIAVPLSASAQSRPSVAVMPGKQNTILRPNSDFQKQWELQKLDLKDPIQAQYAGAVTTAKCVIRRSNGNAAQYFGGPMTKDPKYSALNELLTRKFSNCIDVGEKGVPMYVVNAALAEQLILADSTEYSDKPASLDMDKANAFYLTDGKITSLEALSRCIAVNSPGLVQKLIKSQAGSEVEKAAIETAYSHTPECGVTTPPKLANVEHREMLATGLYQWLQHD